MAGFTGKKRSRDEKPRLLKGRPSKKPRKQREYHSSSEDEEGPEAGQDFTAVNLLDSDAEDLDNMAVDDGESSGSEEEHDPSSSDDSSREGPRVRSKAGKPTNPQTAKREAQRRKSKTGEGDGGGDGESGSGDNTNEEDDSEEDGEDENLAGGGRGKKQSKRNDPTAFATSMSKILSTKLSSSRRADPVLARSAEAHEAARLAVDSALEAKAHRKMAEQRRLALEKGRVRDVLVATANNNDSNSNSNEGGGDDGNDKERQVTTSEMLEAERRLRKVAQRGVIKLFNAVRAAQVKAADAQRAVRAEGVVGMNRREEKVTEMSKKGFLDLIAAGGGGLKKGPLEEA